MVLFLISFTTRETKKLKLMIRDYNNAATAAATKTSFNKFLHSEKTGEKEIRMVRT